MSQNTRRSFNHVPIPVGGAKVSLEVTLFYDVTTKFHNSFLKKKILECYFLTNLTDLSNKKKNFLTIFVATTDTFITSNQDNKDT
jgi:hypothetical protein